MRCSLSLAAAFVCAAAIQSHPTAAAAQQQPYCREFTSTARIDNRNQPLVGQVCRQPDGSWQIVQEGTPVASDVPSPVYANSYSYPYPYPYPDPYAYPYPYPYYWTGAWGPSFGSVFIGDRFGRFDHFRHQGFRRFDRDDFRHGGFHQFRSGFHGGANRGGMMMGGRGGGHH